MSKIIKTLGTIIILSCANTLYAQEFNIQTWDDVITNISEGKKDAFAYLLKKKTEIEAITTWNDEVHQQYMLVTFALVEYYSMHGQFDDEEIVIKEAMHQFNLKDSCANTLYTRQMMRMMGRLQKDIGNIDASLTYAHEALLMYEEAQDYSHSYLFVLHDISTCCIQKKDWLSAKLYIDEAIDMLEEMPDKDKFPINHICHFRNTRGLIETELGHYEQAIADYNYVIENSDHNDIQSAYILTLNNLSVLYTKIGEWNKAIKILEKMAPKTPEAKKYKYQNLSFLYYLTQRQKEAENSLSEYNNALYDECFNIISSFSETERETYLRKNGEELTRINNIVSSGNPTFAMAGFDANLFARSISIAVPLALHGNSHTEKDLCDIQRLNKTRMLALRAGISPVERDFLYREVIDIEKHLLRDNIEISKSVVNYISDYHKIQDSMQEGEIVVMFCYVPDVSDTSNIIDYFGAYIVLPSAKEPHLIKLCKVDSIENIFYNSDPTAEFISDLYSDDKANCLYRLLWEPLEKYTSTAQTVYYSPCGSLNMLNHEALMDNAGNRLGFKTKMICLTSPSELCKFKTDNTNNNITDIALYGAPNFDTTSDELAGRPNYDSKYDDTTQQHDLLSLRKELMRDGWYPLPGAKKEIEAIAKLLNDLNITNTTYIGKNASEEAVKALSGRSPQVIHFATHSFLIVNQAQYNNSTFAQSIFGFTEKGIYMLWSGLVLSGGNKTWRGDKIPYGAEDGILTAEEISRLDLSDTKLVVLSACNTGRGHIDPTEGVLGLQRAFKQSEAKSVLMTLWKIPDSTTVMLMREFYAQLLSGKTVRESLKNAQLYLINNGAADPYYWASFVCID